MLTRLKSLLIKSLLFWGLSSPRDTSNVKSLAQETRCCNACCRMNVYELFSWVQLRVILPRHNHNIKAIIIKASECRNWPAYRGDLHGTQENITVSFQPTVWSHTFHTFKSTVKMSHRTILTCIWMFFMVYHSKNVTQQLYYLTSQKCNYTCTGNAKTKQSICACRWRSHASAAY